MAEVSEAARLPWCSFCGVSGAVIGQRLDDTRKWYYFCDGCARHFCVIGGEGVRYGPVGVSWGRYRLDPIWSVSASGAVDCTADDVDME